MCLCDCESVLRENYIHFYCLFRLLLMHMFGFAFTIARHPSRRERIIVTIDCRLRFVCGEVEVCNYLVHSVVVVVCVCPIRSF